MPQIRVIRQEDEDRRTLFYVSVIWWFLSSAVFAGIFYILFKSVNLFLILFVSYIIIFGASDLVKSRKIKEILSWILGLNYILVSVGLFFMLMYINYLGRIGLFAYFLSFVASAAIFLLGYNKVKKYLYRLKLINRNIIVASCLMALLLIGVVVYSCLNLMGYLPKTHQPFENNSDDQEINSIESDERQNTNNIETPNTNPGNIANAVPTCTPKNITETRFEQRYLVYYRSLLIQNSTELKLYDVTPEKIGFKVTNYLSVPVEIKVDYHKQSNWFGVDEYKTVSVDADAESSVSYQDEGYAANVGCATAPCGLAVTNHTLAGNKISYKLVNQPIITVKQICS